MSSVSPSPLWESGARPRYWSRPFFVMTQSKAQRRRVPSHSRGVSGLRARMSREAKACLPRSAIPGLADVYVTCGPPAGPGSVRGALSCRLPPAGGCCPVRCGRFWSLLLGVLTRSRPCFVPVGVPDLVGGEAHCCPLSCAAQQHLQRMRSSTPVMVQSTRSAATKSGGMCPVRAQLIVISIEPEGCGGVGDTCGVVRGG